ncbi:maleylpyruvate isomerase family mycothiol-dependent enzyme [Streptomyces sp. SID13031]|uniref:maleylpyruvate isomerase family mycothiol-dependent enzyme n=1 Tax=Streptomyces sp. SID13031 TaxID=2706046 RepID=UPI0013C67E94|nr:maleylpyruvate isomerase family mycothiol-dependent enzyme [Streptomyces sp. SID13031]NEA31425.1 maleylpyruvate isomerase family mycothiol-dependent enzyme [Streptomyces sp. SID13031]
MNDVLRWVEAERLSFAELLEDLSDDEWAADSLCAGWTVLDVAAHLTLSTRMTRGMSVWGAIKARGSFDRMVAELARRRATQYSRSELTGQIRATAGSDRRAPGAGPLDPLLDVLVHGQDIARPLGRARAMPMEPAIAALEHVRTSAFYGARKRLRGLKLVATDAAWSGGDGTGELHAPLSDLILLATGRPAALPNASGPGAARLRL